MLKRSALVLLIVTDFWQLFSYLFGSRSASQRYNSTKIVLANSEMRAKNRVGSNGSKQENRIRQHYH